MTSRKHTWWRPAGLALTRRRHRRTASQALTDEEPCFRCLMIHSEEHHQFSFLRENQILSGEGDASAARRDGHWERTIRFIFEDDTRHIRALRFELCCSLLFCLALPPVRFTDICSCIGPCSRRCVCLTWCVFVFVCPCACMSALFRFVISVAVLLAWTAGAALGCQR